MEMEEPWEALDLDETDISSSTSVLRRCTQQPSISSQSPQPSLPPPTQSTTTVSRRRLIPGPAAAIQAAMHRIEQSNLNQNHFSQISTQGYIQRVQQDADEEFSRNPWLFAVNFLRRQCVLNTTPLSAINKCVNAERFDKVVAIVKSCAPNGLGDMIVTLKDPSDTIGASIHGKVFSVGDFGNFISVGAILILRKVVAFSSSCTSSYLNITRSNIDKVISVDCEIKDFSEANPDNTQVFSRSSVISEGTSALVSRRAERVVADVHHLKGKAVMQELTQKTNYNQPKILSSSIQIDNGSLKTLNEPIQIDPVCSGPSGPSIWEGDHSARVSQPDPPYSLEGVVSNFKDFENNEGNRQAGEFSSAAYISETRGNLALQANGTQFERQLLENNLNQSASEKLKKIVDIGKCSGMLKNVDDVDIFGVDDNQKQHHKKIVSVSSIIENLAKRDFSEINGSLKSVCQTENGFSSNVNVQQSCEEAGRTIGIKKPRLKLVSRTAVQEWTDEQLCILDMDEY